jgi:hypothetical protein
VSASPFLTDRFGATGMSKKGQWPSKGSASAADVMLGPVREASESRLAAPVSFALRGLEFPGGAFIAPALSPVHRHGPQEDHDDRRNAADHNPIDEVMREKVHGRMVAGRWCTVTPQQVCKMLQVWPLPTRTGDPGRAVPSVACDPRVYSGDTRRYAAGIAGAVRKCGAWNLEQSHSTEMSQSIGS